MSTILHGFEEQRRGSRMRTKFLAAIALSAIVVYAVTRPSNQVAFTASGAPLPVPAAGRLTELSEGQFEGVLVGLRGKPGDDSAAHQSGDGRCCFVDLLLGLGCASVDGVDDAVSEVLVHQTEGDLLKRLRDRRDLVENVDAVAVFVDHSGNAAHLALDPGEPFGDIGLCIS